MIKYVIYILHIIILLLTVTLPFHTRCMLKYTIFIPLIYGMCYIVAGDECILTNLDGNINDLGFIQGLLKPANINISDKTLGVLQNLGLACISLLAGFKLTATSQNDDTQKFFTDIYNKLGQY
jgi:hypothetical protein